MLIFGQTLDILGLIQVTRAYTPRKQSPSRIWSRGWSPNLLPTRGSQSKPVMVRATSSPVPTPRSLPRSRDVHPSNRPGQPPPPRSAVLESPHRGPPWANATEAPSWSAANPLRGAHRVAVGPSASGTQLAPRPPSQQPGIRALSRRRSGGGCLLWVVTYASTALYQVAQRWSWVVAPSGLVLPPGALYVGVAPRGVRAPLVVPKRCLGGGRGPKSLARWESRQAAQLERVGWRASLDRAGRTNASPSPSEGAASRGARRGPGLGDRLAGGPRGLPNNHNGGSPADPGVLLPGGMLGPWNVCDQSPPGPVVQRDGLRPPLFCWGVGEPLFLLLLRELSGKPAWLSVSLKTSVRLLMQRTYLFLLRPFVTAEDFRLPDTVSIFLRLLGELQPGCWAGLMPVSTSPTLVLQAPDPQVAARGLGDIGTYHNSDALWDEVVGEGVDVERLASEFAPEVSPHRRSSTCVRRTRWWSPCWAPLRWGGGGGGEGGGGAWAARHVLALQYPEVLGEGVGNFPGGRLQRHHAPSCVVQLGKHGRSPQCVAAV